MKGIMRGFIALVFSLLAAAAIRWGVIAYVFPWYVSTTTKAVDDAFSKMQVDSQRRFAELKNQNSKSSPPLQGDSANQSYIRKTPVHQ